MSPEQLQQFSQMQKELDDIKSALGTSFVESVKRRCVEPKIKDFIAFDSDSTTSGLLKSVDEDGASTYNVADAYDDVKVVKIGGTDYKIGVYTA